MCFVDNRLGHGELSYSCVCCMDPLNWDCYYIFGICEQNMCFHVNTKEKTYEKIANMPQPNSYFGCQCVVYETNQTKDACEYYALIYKNETHLGNKVCVIYDFQKKNWTGMKETKKPFVPCDWHPSMTIDIFQKNIVHIVATFVNTYTYG